MSRAFSYRHRRAAVAQQGGLQAKHPLEYRVHAFRVKIRHEDRYVQRPPPSLGAFRLVLEHPLPYLTPLVSLAGTGRRQNGRFFFST